MIGFFWKSRLGKLGFLRDKKVKLEQKILSYQGELNAIIDEIEFLEGMEEHEP